MSTFQIKKSSKVYDVIIAGPGAGGRVAAYQLSRVGLKIALLEAGGISDPKDSRYRTQLKWSYESPRRGASTKLRCFGDFDAAWDGWLLGVEAYTMAEGTKFEWFQSPTIGGRTNNWGHISLRFGPKDF